MVDPSRRLAVLALLLCGAMTTTGGEAAAQTSARATARDTAAIEALVRPYVRTNNFSGQILIARGGHVVFQKAYAQADREHAIPNTLTTPLHVASVSMQFTAAAIMRLIDAGKLTLDTRVATIVPNVPGGDAITIRNLLEQRSGLPDINQRPDYAEILQHHQTPATLVGTISRDTLLFPPGSRYLHEEHSAYNLLALIVEKTARRPFAAALQQLVFTPLHMTHAGADDDAVPASAHLARGYDPDGVLGLKPTTPIHWSAKAGNGSAYLTAADEARWVRALFSGDFLSQAARGVIIDSSGPPVGYGWFRRPNTRLGEFAYSMSGRAPGFSSYVIHLPRSDLTVVVLSNIYSSVTSQIGTDLAALVLGKPYTPFVVGAPLTPTERSAIDGLAFRFPTDFYQPDATLVVRSGRDGLFLHWPSGDLTPLIPGGRDHFIDRAYWEPVAVERNAAGRPVAMTYDRFRGVAVDRVVADTTKH